ncbi:11045_t:CDS:10 [Gigaspora rosea]|nr:11045_t:CDS:10 [Gigaspora rosea]
MLQSKSFLKRTKKGNAIKVVQEHYLRDDIWCSVECCKLCVQTGPVLSTSAMLTAQIPRPHYIVPDTNVFMNQIDIIEHPALHDVIIMQTVYEEIRHLSLPIYNRLRALINDQKKRFYVFSNEHHRETYIQRLKDESPNDRNDRAIRSAVKWYSTHLKKITNKENHIEVVLLTDDVGNRTKAQEEGLSAFSVREYVEGMTDTPELVDILGNSSNVEGDKKVPYEEGSILSNVNGVDTQIMILGRPCLNRAIQGDVVAVQLLPKSEWLRTPTAVVVEEEEEANVNADLKEDGEPKEQNDELENEVIESSQPTGKIVGIIKRNWRPYCGFISKKSVKSSATSTFSENVLVVPMDRRIPYIYIRTRQAQNLMGQRILVSIDAWPKNSTALGAAGDKSTETEVLLLEHDVPFQEFASQVLNGLPVEGEAWRVTEEHLSGRAVYFCSGTLQFQDFRHYGLAAGIYTHFTSPIRRYSDVIVHRLLHAAINPDKNYGQELVDINKMQKLSDGKIEHNEGYVTRVLKNGFIVLVPKYGIEGIVYSSSASSTTKSPTTPLVVYNSHNNSLESVTPNGTVSIKLFDKVIVQITVDEDLVDGMRQKMKMELVSPFIPGLSVSDNTLRKKEIRIEDEGGNGKRMRIDD